MSEKETDKKRKNRMKRNVAIVVSVIAVFLVTVSLYFVPVSTQKTELGIIIEDHDVGNGVVFTFKNNTDIYDYFWSGTINGGIVLNSSYGSYVHEQIYDVYGFQIADEMVFEWRN